MNHKTKLSLLFSGLMLFVSAVYMSCSSSNVGDSDDPSTIEDLVFDILTRQLTWTATGDDGDSGKAKIYDLRFFDDAEVAELLGLSLDDFNTSHPTLDPAIEEAVKDNFEDATQIQDEPEPDEAGTPESFVLDRINTEGTERFFFALTARDEVGNNSSPSNVVEVQTPLAPVEFGDSTGGSCFGESVGSGDFDGDGTNDIVIGDPCLGMVYIFFGRKNLAIGSDDGDEIYDVGSADMAAVTIIGDAGDQFGASVAGVGDIGGDNKSDLAIGAPEFDGETGRVYVVFGNSDLAETIDFTSGDQPNRVITGENAGDNFGASVTSVTDVEGGGGRRLLVGAPGANSGRGKAYLFRGGDIGGNTSASDAQAIFLGESAGDMFGSALSRGGDFDDDSFSEFAVGAPGAGKVYVFFGQDNINGKDLSIDTSGVVIVSGGAANEFGTSIAGGEDIDEDGDGTPDLIIGSPGSNSNKGSVFLYSGKDIGSAKTNGTPLSFETEFTGESPGDGFGTSVSIFKDIDPRIDREDVDNGSILSLKRTNADFATGAPMASGGRGRVYIFFGKDDFSSSVAATEADVILEGTSSSEHFGRVLSALGDITKDFVEDFAVGGVDVVRAEF